jgi:DNA-binding response OmpR family regulator/DNA-binding CsgD family transcriptional regulator
MLRRDTILVVDDSPETLGFLTDTLDHAGFTVLIATDAYGALDLVDRITPDLVLLDAMMPGMDGFEACRRLKNDKLLRHLPVIFMTGLDDTQRVVEGLAAGGVDYLVKPIVIDELLARVRVHLDNARSANGSRAALDASGRYLFATDRAGRLLWCTPKARDLLLAALTPHDAPIGERDAALPAELVENLLRAMRQDAQPAAVPAASPSRYRGAALDFTFLGPTGPDEYLFCLADTGALGASEEQAVQGGHDRQEVHEALRRNLQLTRRESEVLLWISRGKTNRDIGEILGISPRTINKHLERIFVKLGVENRASAAVHAERVLAAARQGDAFRTGAVSHASWRGI